MLMVTLASEREPVLYKRHSTDVRRYACRLLST